MGIKQLSEDPWKNLDERYPLNAEVIGSVVNITDFGIFVEISDGIEGLVHISEIDSAVPKAKLQEFYPAGTEVRARVIKIDTEERRLGLSILEVVGVAAPALDDAPEEPSAEAEEEEAPAEAEESKD